MLKLNLGCGPVQPDGWVNVDGSMRAWVASRLWWLDRCLVTIRLWPPTEFNRKTRFANLLKRFPWGNDSVDCVYMGEVLEHFTAQEGLHLLGECWRVLKPGGTIRVRVPDNARFWRNYLKEFDEAHQRPRQEWTVNHTRWIDLFFRDICVRPKLWRSIGHYHKYMYDEISLIRTLEGVGFIGAERRGFLDSAIEDVRVVETRDDLTVEATKPTTPRSQP